MNRRIQVCIGEAKEPVGTLLYETSGNRESCSFAYHPEWLASPKRFALSPDLPLQAGMMFHPRTRDGSTFFDCIADTEPDGWGKRVILRDHTKRRKQSLQQGLAPNTQPLNALDYLLAVDDISRVGALRFLDESGIPQRSHHDAERGTPPLIDLGKIYRASLAVEQEKETAADLAYLRGKGTSLGGMRPKCTVIDHDGSLCLGKFPSIGDDRAVTKGEILALALADAAGINAAKGRVEMVDVIRKVSPHAKQDMAELWRRMVFNILITNVDDHLNNHGFLHRGHGQWVLSPAFDLNPFPDKQRELKTWISEDSGPSGSIRDCLAVARYFGLDKADTTRILKEVTTPVKNWCNLATKVGMSGTERDKFEPAFEHGELEQALSAT